VQALSSLMSDEAMRNALAARAAEVVTRFPVEASLKAWDALLGDITPDRGRTSNHANHC
jgi:hypothetical protein